MDKSKLLIASPDRKPLLGILALIFLLTMTLSEVTSSQANEDGKQNPLRQAAQGWMQVGIQQYQRSLFEAAEKSFRRAQVYQKYLTAAEREQLNEFLEKARIAGSEGKHISADTQTSNKLIEQDQPIKAKTHVENLEDSEPLTKEEPEQSAQKLKDITSQPTEQEKQIVEKAEPAVTEDEDKVVPSQRVPPGSIEGLINKLTQYSSRLNNKQWQKWGLLTAAMLTVVLLLLVERRKRGGTVKRVYENQVQERSSVIGTRLAGFRQNHKGIEVLDKGRLAYVPKSNGRQKRWRKTIKQWKKLNRQVGQLQPGTTERKQATEHLKQQTAEVKLQHKLTERKRAEERPKQQADEVPAAGKPLQRDREWPPRSFKYEESHRVLGQVKQKLCRKCEKWKAESEFHKNRSCKDGLARWCKECKAKAAKEYRKRRKATKN